MKLLPILVFVTLCGAVWTRLTYEGYQVWRVTPTIDDELKFLKELEQGSGDLFDFWTPVRGVGNHVDVLVGPPGVDKEREEFRQRLNGMSIKITIPDVKKLIDQNMAPVQQKDGHFDFSVYHTHEEIMAFVDEVVTKYPTIVRKELIGLSYQGRDLPVLKISSDRTGSKKVIWLDFGIHAREWISPATGVWVINKLTEGYYTDPDVRYLVDNLEWHILPVHNPDGYHWSWTEDRLWRKSRQKFEPNVCIGTDINRNFDAAWLTVGASPISCSSTYAGPYASSEPETTAVSDYVMSMKDRVGAFLTIHSYSQLLLSPYGYTTDYPPNYDELMRIANMASNALRAVHGTVYTVGHSGNTLYETSGTSQDWAYVVPEIPISFTFELRDEGQYGFLLPPEQIVPTAEETWEAFRVFGEEVISPSG